MEGSSAFTFSSDMRMPLLPLITILFDIFTGNGYAFLFSDEDQYKEKMVSPISRFPRSVESMIPEDYNPNTLPPTAEIPNKVNVSALIVSVKEIKEIEEEISIEMNLRLQWKDERLARLADALHQNYSTTVEILESMSNTSKRSYVLLQPTLIYKIWSPDIFIDHLKKIEQPAVLSKPASFRMYSDYSLRYSTRVTIVVSCPMDFHNYPADTQRCNVELKSYGYTEDRLMLQWREKFGANFANPNLELQNFYLTLDNPYKFKTKTLSGRKYAGLRFTIILTRKLSYHMIQTFLPSIILVIVSWLSFLMNLDAVPARTAVIMTCLLTLISMFASVRQGTPTVSYVKAMDIWMVVCVFFVFLTLLEFTVALKLKSIKEKCRTKKLKRRGAFLIDETQMGNINLRPQTNSRQALPRSPNSTCRNYKTVERLEFISSLGIPALFIIFNCLYWPWLILTSEYLTQHAREVVGVGAGATFATNNASF